MKTTEIFLRIGYGLFGVLFGLFIIAAIYKVAETIPPKSIMIASKPNLPRQEVLQKVEPIGEDWLLTTNSWYYSETNGLSLVCHAMAIEYKHGPHINRKLSDNNIWVIISINDSVKCAQKEYVMGKLKEYVSKISSVNCNN